MSDLAVFVVNDGGRGLAVRELVTAWARAGLVGPSVWVTPSGVTTAEHGPPVVRAERVTSEGVEEGDLFHMVGLRRLSTVRVVVGQLVDVAEAEHADVVEAGRLVAEQIRTTLPRSNDDASARDTVLFRANLIIPVSGAHGLTSRALLAGWDVNAVVSAEDRPDIDRASVFVRSPGNFDGHAAMVLAATGGVVDGVPVGALDDAAADSTTHAGDLVVLRVSLRAVVGEDVIRKLTEAAVSGVRGELNGPATYLAWGRTAVEPVRLAQRATDHLLQHGDWKPRPAPEQPAPRRASRRFRDVLREAVRFNASTTGSVLRWVVGRGKERVEHSATGAIVGHDGDTLVHLGAQPPEVLKEAASGWLARESSEAQRAAADREVEATAVPSPTTWADLRRFVFALNDGADLPEGFEEPTYAGVRELLPADHVAPRPATLRTQDGTELRSDDPVAVRTAVLELGRSITQQQELVQDLRRQLAEEEAAASLASNGEEAPKARAAATDPPSPLRRRIEKQEKRLADLQAERSTVQRFLDTASVAVTWRLADDVGRRTFALRARHRATVEQQPVAPPHEELVAAQRSLVRWWRITPLVWFVIAGLAYVLLDQQDASVAGRILWLVGLTLVAAALLVRANHRFYKAVRRYEWSVQVLIALRKSELDEYVYTAQEAARLDLLYEGLRSWSRIVAHVLHEQWVDVTTGDDGLSESVIDAFPAAMGVARPVRGEEAFPQATLVAAIRALHPRGWNTARFDLAYAEFSRVTPLDESGGYLAVDLDTLDSPLSPRSLLEDFWTSHRAAEVVTENATQILEERVDEDSIHLPVRTVVRIGAYSDGESVSEPAFFRPTAQDATSFVNDMFTAAGLQGTAHYTRRSRAWIPRVAGVSRGAAGSDRIRIDEASGSCAVRVDLSRTVGTGDLTLFAGSSAENAAPGAPDDDTAQHGASRGAVSGASAGETTGARERAAATTQGDVTEWV